MSLPLALFLMGPTASGKTAATIDLVQRLPIEIISVDSALVYRDMNIGTAKPDAATLAIAPHHLIDLIDPTESYSAAQFRADALRLMHEITQRGNVPLLVGGTMLYFNALQHGMHQLPEADTAIRAALETEANQVGWPAMHAKLAALDPITAARLQPNDSQRIERALEIVLSSGKPMSQWLAEQRDDPPPYRLCKMALMPSDRAALHARIAQRFEHMLQQGFLDELSDLRKHYELDPDMPSMRCVGYRQAWQYLDGYINYATLRDTGIFATRQLAKRQMTWLRGMQDTVTLDCLAPNLAEAVVEVAKRELNA